MEKKLPYYAMIVNCYDGLGTIRNDIRFIRPHLKKVVSIIYQIKTNLYLTDLFIPEFKDLNSDYIYHGFLIVSEENIKVLKQFKIIEL